MLDKRVNLWKGCSWSQTCTCRMNVINQLSKMYCHAAWPWWWGSLTSVFPFSIHFTSPSGDCNTFGKKLSDKLASSHCNYISVSDDCVRSVRKGNIGAHITSFTRLFINSGGSRIFPRGGANSQKCYYFSILSPKTAWKWKNLGPQGGGASLAPPLRSAND